MAGNPSAKVRIYLHHPNAIYVTSPQELSLTPHSFHPMPLAHEANQPVSGGVNRAKSSSGNRVVCARGRVREGDVYPITVYALVQAPAAPVPVLPPITAMANSNLDEGRYYYPELPVAASGPVGMPASNRYIVWARWPDGSFSLETNYLFDAVDSDVTECESGSGSGSGSENFLFGLQKCSLLITVSEGHAAGSYAAYSTDGSTWHAQIGKLGVWVHIGIGCCPRFATSTCSVDALEFEMSPFSATFPGSIIGSSESIVVTQV